MGREGGKGYSEHPWWTIKGGKTVCLGFKEEDLEPLEENYSIY